MPLTTPVAVSMDMPAGSPVALQVSANPPLELPAIVRSYFPPATLRLPGLVTVTASADCAVDITHPSAELLHNGCMANEPVDRLTSAEDGDHAHSSAISPPETLSLGSHHPETGNGSVMVSAYSWPPTMENPSSVPWSELTRQGRATYRWVQETDSPLRASNELHAKKFLHRHEIR